MLISPTPRTGRIYSGSSGNSNYSNLDYSPLSHLTPERKIIIHPATHPIIQSMANQTTHSNPQRIPLSSMLPPLILGTGTFNTQYTLSISDVPTNAIVARALQLGIRAFDTSPYYGPSETLLGAGLSQPEIRSTYPRESYMLLTKVGRIGYTSFDYSAGWVRQSVARSLERLQTSYLDVVYCHDIEFVSASEVLTAVCELRRLRDEEHTVRYVGICGYPIPVLVSLSQLILQETGEPIDIVQSYSNFNVQNSRLASEGLEALSAARVDVVTNASVLSMGLLRRNGVPASGQGDWHPAPKELRAAIARVSDLLDQKGERLETLAIRYAMEHWLTVAEKVGTRGGEYALGVEAGKEAYSGNQPAPTLTAQLASKTRLGVSVMGVSKIEELDETMRVWRNVLLTYLANTDEKIVSRFSAESGPRDLDGDYSDIKAGRRRREEVQRYAEEIKALLGEWYDFVWKSPGEGYVNTRHVDEEK